MVASLRGSTLRNVRIEKIAPAILGPSNFKIYSAAETLIYLSAYQTGTGGSILPYYNMALDSGNVAPSFVLSNADADVSFYTSQVGAARSLYTIVDDPGIDKTAFEVIVGGGNLAIGVTNDFADPALVNGGATGYIMYDKSGTISGEVLAGSYGPYSVPAYTAGDVIGIVQKIFPGYGDTDFWFFKNGLLIHSTSTILSFYSGIAVITQS